MNNIDYQRAAFEAANIRGPFNEALNHREREIAFSGWQAAIAHDRQQRENTLDIREYNIDFKALYEKMCERCDALDAKLAEYEQQRGEVVVTWDESRTRILAVTRQDSEGKILSVIAEAPAQQRGEPVGYIMPTALRQLQSGGHAVVSGVSQGWDIPIFTAPQPAEPVKRSRPYATGTAGEEFGVIPTCDMMYDGPEPVKGPSDAEGGL